MWTVHCTRRPLYPPGKSPSYLLTRRPCGPHSWFGRSVPLGNRTTSSRLSSPLCSNLSTDLAVLDPGRDLNPGLPKFEAGVLTTTGSVATWRFKNEECVNEVDKLYCGIQSVHFCRSVAITMSVCCQKLAVSLSSGQNFTSWERQDLFSCSQMPVTGSFIEPVQSIPSTPLKCYHNMSIVFAYDSVFQVIWCLLYRAFFMCCISVPLDWIILQARMKLWYSSCSSSSSYIFLPLHPIF